MTKIKKAAKRARNRLKEWPYFEPSWNWLSLGVMTLAVGLTPLLFTTASRELFEWPKMVAMYCLALVSVILLLVRLVADGKISLPTRQLSGVWLIYIGLFVVATGTSISLYSSVMGYYSRFHGGLASLIAYVMIAWLCYVYITAGGRESVGDRLKPLIYVWVGSASLVSVWAVLEHFGRDISCWLLTGAFDTGCWVQDVQARVFATFGQPNWLAAYLLTAIPLSLIGLIQSRGSNRWWWIGAAWLQFAALWYTLSRAGWIGLAVSVGVLLLCLPWSSIRQQWRWLGMVGVGCLIIGLASAQAVGQRTSSSLEGGDFDSSTGQMRLLVWEGSLKLIEQRPWLGSGPETFAYSFLSVRPAAMNLTTEWNFLYNKAHNEVLQTATDRGLLGLASWVGVWLSLLWVSYKSGIIARKELTATKAFGVGLLSGMLGVMASQFFGFSVVMTGLLWWIGMVLIAAMAEAESSYKPVIVQLKGWWLGLVVVGVMGLVGLAGYGLSRYVSAEVLSTQAGKGSSVDNQLSRAPHQAVILNPWEPYYAQQLASHYSGQASATLETERQQAFASIGLGYAEAAERLNPNNLITKKQLGWTYAQLRQVSDDYARAEVELWRRAVTLAPTDASSWWSLAKVYREQGKAAEAEQAYARLVELRPVGEVYGDRSAFYKEIGQLDKARADLAKAAELEPWNSSWATE